MRAGVPRALNLLVTVAELLGVPAQAQHGRHAPPRPDSVARQDPAPSRGEALRVFLGCAGFACDDDYIHTEIRFVTWVRERQDAQVDILITSQTADVQGAEYTAQFTGRREFAGEDDSLHFAAPADASEEQIRSGLAQLLKRGLLRYVNHTPLGARMQVSYVPQAATRDAAAPRDPWNHWVFATSVSGSANGEQSTSLVSISGSLSADRTTEAWKINSTLQGGYSASRVDAGAAGTFTTLQRNAAFDILVVRSIGGHWAAGAHATATASTFLNQSLTVRLGPAIEYNLFRYAESARRQFTIQYSMGVTHLDYIERTIFGKLSERLTDEHVLASVQLKQLWGSIGASLEGSHYLNDLSKRRAIGVANADVHLFRGVSLLLIGGAELVHDQLFLPQRGASTEEILLQQRELATSYQYFSSVGLSFTFGSPFAAVVNSRFAGSSAGTNILQ